MELGQQSAFWILSQGLPTSEESQSSSIPPAQA